jgi:hypothetical protein
MPSPGSANAQFRVPRGGHNRGFTVAGKARSDGSWRFVDSALDWGHYLAYSRFTA